MLIENNYSKAIYALVSLIGSMNIRLEFYRIRDFSVVVFDIVCYSIVHIYHDRYFAKVAGYGEVFFLFPFVGINQPKIRKL